MKEYIFFGSGSLMPAILVYSSISMKAICSKFALKSPNPCVSAKKPLVDSKENNKMVVLSKTCRID